MLQSSVGQRTSTRVACTDSPPILYADQPPSKAAESLWLPFFWLRSACQARDCTDANYERLLKPTSVVKAPAHPRLIAPGRNTGGKTGLRKVLPMCRPRDMHARGQVTAKGVVGLGTLKRTSLAAAVFTWTDARRQRGWTVTVKAPRLVCGVRMTMLLTR